jgi:hypothetical protein
MDDWLVGGRVQRVRVGRVGPRDVVLCQVRLPAYSGFFVLAGGIGGGVVEREAHSRLREAMAGDARTHLHDQAYWRARVEGARVIGLWPGEARFSHDGKEWRALVSTGSPFVTLEASDTPASLAGAAPIDPDALRQTGDRIVEKIVAGAASWRVEALRKGLARAMKRVERRRDAIHSDLVRAREAEDKARAAEPFVGEAARAPRGATKLIAVDWSDGDPREVVFLLDPARTAREQLDALFRRARRLRDGARIAEARLEEAEASLSALSSAALALASCHESDVPAIEARAHAAAPRDLALSTTPAPRASRGSAKQPPAPPYRTYLAASGARILVGRGAEKNDALTFHVARPHDLWLHAKSRAGAHVIVPLAKGASCPADVLVEAAHLALHFSEARQEAVVEVQYTTRRYVRKPRGSAPGLVVVDREKVMLLRRDEALLRRLLEREQA